MLNKFDCNMSVNFLHICAVGHLVPSVECCHLEELFRSSLGKRRSRTMFLHITLADIMVTLFPIAGQPPHQGHSTKVDPDSRTQQTLSQAARPQTNTCLYSILANLCPLILFQVRWCGRSWTDAGQRDGDSARCHLQFQYIYTENIKIST